MITALVGMVVLLVGEADHIENQMVVNINIGKYKLLLTTQYFFYLLHPDFMWFHEKQRKTSCLHSSVFLRNDGPANGLDELRLFSMY